ncbi:MAG: hypothetical protein VR67_04070 [Peptococcaceae bacterium BRH_c8a]|nr:MAG: hypothetical protein VR67_04070 [Peptococcaceae bacterium BRH_c8a]
MADTIMRGVLAGLFAAVADSLIGIAAYLELGTLTTAHYLSELIFPHHAVNLIRYGFGLIVHFIAAALLGVLLAIIFKHFGSDYAYPKGMGFGLILWVIYVLVIPNIVYPHLDLYHSEMEAGVDLIGHVVYGLVATYYLVKTEEKPAV